MPPVLKSTIYAILYYLACILLLWVVWCYTAPRGPCDGPGLTIILLFIAMLLGSFSLFIIAIMRRVDGHRRYTGPLLVHGFVLLSASVLLFL